MNKERTTINRRTLAKGAAWATPAVLSVAAVPAYATSPQVEPEVVSRFGVLGAAGTYSNENNARDREYLESAIPDYFTYGSCSTEGSPYIYARQRLQGQGNQGDRLSITQISPERITDIVIQFWLPSEDVIFDYGEKAGASEAWNRPAVGNPVPESQQRGDGYTYHRYIVDIKPEYLSQVVRSDGAGGSIVDLTTYPLDFVSECMNFGSASMTAVENYLGKGRFVTAIYYDTDVAITASPYFG